MKMARRLSLAAVTSLLAPFVAVAQGSGAGFPPPEAPAPEEYRIRKSDLPAQGVMKRSPAAAPMARGGPDLGAWWKNSAIAAEIGLSEQQISQIEQTFFDHRLKLIDLKATVEREETRLQPLMEADVVDEARIGPQIDKVLAARSALEKANVMMMLSIRKVLTVDQWKKLESMRHHREDAVHMKMRMEEESRRRQWMRREAPPPPPPPDAPIRDAAARIRVESHVQQSQLIHHVKPAYTPLAQQARIQGTVRLQAIIARDGRVTSLQVVHGHPLLVQSALEAVRQWRYEPTLRDGEPVEVITTVDVPFGMTD